MKRKLTTNNWAVLIMLGLITLVTLPTLVPIGVVFLVLTILQINFMFKDIEKQEKKKEN